MVREEAYPQRLMEDYELIAHLSNEEVNILRKKVATEIKNYFGDKEIIILEIGSGNGETTEFILDNVENAKIIAVDNDKGMIARMKKKLQKYFDSGKLQVVCTDAFEYIKSLEEESIDCFTSSWTMHNFEKDQRKKLLEDIHRSLKKGGFFVMMDKIYTGDKNKDSQLFDQTMADYAKLKELGKNDLFDDLVKHEEEDSGEDYILIESSFMKEMEGRGFTSVRIITRFHREAVLTARK